LVVESLTSNISPYDALLVGAFLFIIEEMALLIVFRKDGAGWHYRFATVEGHGNLRPVVATVKVASYIFSISLIALPIIGLAFFEPLSTYLGLLQFNILLLGAALAGGFFFIWHYVVGKDWNLGQVLCLVLFGILIILLILLNSGVQPQEISSAPVP